MKRIFCICLLLAALAPPVLAQDIRGLENCSAEKQMERRTGCQQGNAEFLQQTIQKNATETRQKLSLAEKEIAAAHKEIAALKSESASLKETLGKMQAKLDELQKAKTAK